MQISELMTSRVISVRQSETVDTAARLLSRNNIGAMPVCDDQSRVVGMVTDRDIVTRCMAAGLHPGETPVAQIMTSGVMTAVEDEPVEAVAARMGRAQVRRTPVVRDGRLTGIVSLADLARSREERTGQTLEEISRNISRR